MLMHFERNRIPLGEARRHSKLTNANVYMIRHSPLSGLQLAKQLGVAHDTIDKVRNGVTWKHLL